MSVTPAIALIQIAAFMICVGIGYLISLPFRPPENPTIWIMMIAVIFVIGYLPPLTFPVFIFGAPMQFSMLLWGVGVGAIIGLMIKRGKGASPAK
jgi:hypothetical protein